MNIKTQLSEKDFINVNMTMLYRKTVFKVMLVTGILFLVVNIVLSIWANSFDGSTIILPLIICGVLPLSTWFQSRKMFRESKRMGETVSYDFDGDNLFIKGESYEARVEWSNIVKVAVTKEWVLIFINKTQAYPIHRRDFWDGELHDLKQVLDKRGIKYEE